MIDREMLAGMLYTKYTASVGGLAFNGDRLPPWYQFRNDPAKKKQSDAWIAVADEAIDILCTSRGAL